MNALLQRLPCRGNFAVTEKGTTSNQTLKVYVCDHETEPPENQNISTDSQNILIRSLILRRQRDLEKRTQKQKGSSGETKEDAKGKKRRSSGNNYSGQNSSERAAKKDKKVLKEPQTRDQLKQLTKEQLKTLLREHGLESISPRLKKDELVQLVLDKHFDK